MQGEVWLSEDEFRKLGDAIAKTAAMIDAATHRFLTDLRRFEEGGGWHLAGALSCAHWLSWRIGMRVANGENEEALLGMARETTAGQMEKICRMTRQVQASDRGEGADARATRIGAG
jgi:hypothetical protein